MCDEKLWNDPPDNFENLHFNVLSNDDCKFAIYLFPITWGPFENDNLFYFLLKMQIWNGCYLLNITGNPIKDISVNLSILSVWWKVVEWTPPKLVTLLTSFLNSGSKVVECTPETNWHLVLHCSAFWIWLLWHLISVFSFDEYALLSI